MRGLREIVNGLSRHPLRTVLVCLTFSLGFASVIATIATVEGGRLSIRRDLESLGVDVVAAINPLRVGPIVIGDQASSARPIDNGHVAELTEMLGLDVRAVVPFRMELAQVMDEEWRVQTSLMATTPEFIGVMPSGLLAGRFFRAGEDFSGDAVSVVVDEALARDFAPEDPASVIGTTLDAYRSGRSFRAHVVGVMKDPITLRRHLDVFDASRRARRLAARRLEFKNLYVPFEFEGDAPSGVLVQAHQLSDIEAVGQRMAAFFSERGADPYYHVQKRWIDSISEIVDRFSALSHFFWILDLVVVLVLSATIALLAIEERYHEIAIRRVEGAGVSQVVLPLLGEGALTALISIPLGYLLAHWILNRFVEPILAWQPVLPAAALAGLPVLLLLVGILSNTLPARRVARLSPAVVLREYEGEG